MSCVQSVEKANCKNNIEAALEPRTVANKEAGSIRRCGNTWHMDLAVRNRCKKNEKKPIQALHN